MRLENRLILPMPFAFLLLFAQKLPKKKLKSGVFILILLFFRFIFFLDFFSFWYFSAAELIRHDTTIFCMDTRTV